MDSLSFIIPSYNDETTIGTVIKKTVAVGKGLAVPFDMFVINDASRDLTGKKLDSLRGIYKNLHVVTHTKNAGYGGTIKELYYMADHTWLCSLPGDYQIEPDQVRILWKARKSADIIIGWRKIRQDSPGRLRQSFLYNMLLRALFGIHIHDVNSVRLMRTSVLPAFSLTSHSAFVDAELVIRAKRAGYTVTEIPIAHRKREGKGAGGGKLATIIPTVIDMLRFYME